MKYISIFIICLLLISSLIHSQELVNAVKDKKKERVSTLLASGADVNVTDPKGATPLSWAIRNNDTAMVNLLIKNHADINTSNDSTPPALIVAAGKGYHAITKALLANGATVNTVFKYKYNYQYSSEISPLMVAVGNGQKDITTLLLNNGADINQQETVYHQLRIRYADGKKKTKELKVLGLTPLMIAVRHRNQEMVKLLLKRKPNIDMQSDSLQALQQFSTKDDSGKQIYSITAEEYNTKSAELNTPVKADNALMTAVKGDDVAITRLLLEAGANPNINYFSATTPLRVAFNHRTRTNPNDTMIKLLIEHGADVNQKSDIKSNPLLSLCVMNDDIEFVRLLLNHGANIDQVTQQGNSSIMFAAQMGNENMMKLLLQHHPNLNQQNNKGETALMMASTGKCVKCVELLLQSGADITLKNMNNKTALAYAKILGNKEIMEALVKAGAKE